MTKTPHIHSDQLEDKLASAYLSVKYRIDCKKNKVVENIEKTIICEYCYSNTNKKNKLPKYREMLVSLIKDKYLWFVYKSESGILSSSGNMTSESLLYNPGNGGFYPFSLMTDNELENLLQSNEIVVNLYSKKGRKGDLIATGDIVQSCGNLKTIWGKEDYIKQQKSIQMLCTRTNQSDIWESELSVIINELEDGRYDDIEDLRKEWGKICNKYCIDGVNIPTAEEILAMTNYQFDDE